jgi:hypothetical protein
VRLLVMTFGGLADAVCQRSGPTLKCGIRPAQLMDAPGSNASWTRPEGVSTFSSTSSECTSCAHLWQIASLRSLHAVVLELARSYPIRIAQPCIM